MMKKERLMTYAGGAKRSDRTGKGRFDLVSPHGLRLRDTIEKLTYHLIAAVSSNGAWFLTFRQLVLRDVDALLFVPYTMGTVSGSLLGVKISMWIERLIDARSDSHLVKQS